MKSNLVKRGFLSLIFTQFFGAANDNMLKGVLTFMVIDGVWSGRLGAGGQGLVALCFTIPFIVLSGYAGQFADRNSKRYVSVLVKVVEIPIAATALLGFWFGNLWITLAALVALSCQSAFFGPAKYGMIPELVDDRDLSRANGTINMMTNIAVILGTLLAGEVADRYDPLPASDGSSAPAVLWLPGALMLAAAAAGLIAVLFLVRLEPGDKNLKYNPNPFAIYISAIREMSKSPLLMVMLAWGYFYLLAGLALLIIPEYTVVLKIDRAEASVLLGVLGAAIGLGSVTAGLISGHRIEPRLIPIGALGITVFFVLLGTVEPALPALAPKLRVAFSSVSGFIFGAGFFAGFYIIPLQAMLQKLSPDSERGRFLGTANAISFSFLAIGSLLFWFIKPLFIDNPQRIFLVSAALMLVGAAFFLVRLRHTVFSSTRPA
ncbi:MAG: MFS transporter [Planctomycetes bacterium]|nr:MFS transporter [Planctomycetota bacterium]